MYSCTAVDCLHDSSNLPPYNTLRIHNWYYSTQFGFAWGNSPDAPGADGRGPSRQDLGSYGTHPDGRLWTLLLKGDEGR